jgi:hypothetical protein
MNIIQVQQDLLKIRFQRSEGRFIERNDCLEIIASNGSSCFIDKEDADLAVYSWNQTNGYFARHSSRKHPTSPNRSLYLHSLILERKLGRQLKEGEYTDHIDWDKSNNRRINLRLSSKSENAINSQGQKRTRTQRFKGVTRAINTYRVQLNYSTSISECGFTDEVEAAKRYDELAAQYHGKYAFLNFPEDWVFDLELQRYKKQFRP